MNFFEFLVKNEKVPISDLIKAEVFRRESSISLLSVLNEIEPESAVIGAIMRQVETGKDLIAVQNEFSIFSEAGFKAAIEAFHSGHLAIGEALVKTNALSIDRYHELLNEFGSISAEKKQGPGSAEEMVEPSGNVVSSAALDSLRELVESGDIDPDLLAELEAESGIEGPSSEMKEGDVLQLSKLDSEFFDCFETEAKEKIFLELKERIVWDGKDFGERREKLEEFYTGVHKLKGAASLINAKLFQAICERIERPVEACLEGSELEAKDIALIEEGLFLLLGLSKFILKKSNESSFLMEPQFKERAEKFLGASIITEGK